VPDWVKQFLDEWFTAAEINTGKFFRCVCRSGTVWGDGITEKVISSNRERPSRNRTDRVNPIGPDTIRPVQLPKCRLRVHWTKIR